MANEKTKKKNVAVKAMETLIKPIVKKPAEKKKKNLAPHRLFVLFTIVNRNKAEFFTDFISQFEVNASFTTMAFGTSNPHVLYELGATDSEKAIIISVIREENVKPLLSAFDEKVKAFKNSKGVAFTVPMTSLIGVSAFQFLANKK